MHRRDSGGDPAERRPRYCRLGSLRLAACYQAIDIVDHLQDGTDADGEEDRCPQWRVRKGADPGTKDGGDAGKAPLCVSRLAEKWRRARLLTCPTRSGPSVSAVRTYQLAAMSLQEEDSVDLVSAVALLRRVLPRACTRRMQAGLKPDPVAQLGLLPTS